MLAAVTIDTDDKMRLLSWLILAPMTPNQFRTLLEDESDFLFVGIFYDNLLKTEIRHRKKPVVAEGIAMKKTKDWWLQNLDEEVKTKIQKAYYEGMPIFTVNLARNYPYGTNNPWQCMENGCPIYDLPRLLQKVITPEAADEVVNQIKELGGDGLYEVRIAPDKPGSPNFVIAVVDANPNA